MLKVRLEMAKFLQETIRESGIKSPDKIKESETFKEFFRKVPFRLFTGAVVIWADENG